VLDGAQDTERFEALLDRCERLSGRGVPFDELREVGRLYRRHSARLARLRERNDDPEAVRHLNALCVRAYTFLYTGPAAVRSPRTGTRTAFLELVGRTWRVQAMAWLLLITGMLLGGGLAYRDPRALPALLPESMGYSSNLVDRLAASPSARARFLEREAAPLSRNFLFGSYLFVHNTQVALLSFATGMLMGIPTMLLQLYNGIVLGAFASIFLRDPRPVTFIAWILPHGIPELTAVTLCAAGGLLLGEAVAAPGRRSRREALRAAVTPALALFVAAIPLLALAAAVESFIRESAIGTLPRLLIAALMILGLIATLAGVRHLSRRVTPDTRWLRALTAPAHNEGQGSDSVPSP
jgi:uncharacterized membrane protein SpoIIM required for sporulation